eukprot:TRINITY_DN80232_c0_g1_i1.p1 TRINITY_DN80232_c0_g1~~TRINITY_DN80232_c0_g1_i1.p1  ORF type:complete len:399 (+),score=73.62 TRINITY_DN80232_c0_g1_i1:77-1273(+)
MQPFMKCVVCLPLFSHTISATPFWPEMLQGPSHRGERGRQLSPPERKPELRWKHMRGEQQFVETSLSVGEDLLFGAAAKTVFALDRRTGKEVWTFNTGKEIVASGALAGSGTEAIYMIGSDDRNFYALEAETGKLLWKFKAGEFTGGPTVGVEEGVVYVGSTAKKLHAYFLNGTKLFEFRTKGEVCSTPALDETGIYFGDDGGNFYKLDRKTHTLEWHVKMPANVRSPARLEPDGIYITWGDPDELRSGQIVKLSYDGKVQWQSNCGIEGEETCGGSCWTSPAVVEDVVVAACGLDAKPVSGFIWGLEKEDGAVRWKVKAENDCQTSSPVVMGGVILIGCTDGFLRAIRASDGEVLWTYRANKGIWATTALDEDGRIYFGSHDSSVYALESPSGTKEL